MKRSNILAWTLALAVGACGRVPLDAAPNDVTDEARACDAPGASDDPNLVVEGLPGGPGTAHVGLARVEQSTADALTLAFTGGFPDDADVQRVVIHGAPAPSLPLGRLVWLAQAVSNADTFGMSPSSWILLVSDREQGTVLFGTSHERPGETLTPFPIGALSSLCTTGSCPTTTWMALDVPNATPSPLSDGTSATLTFGGQAYRLWVHASDQHLDPAACGVESFVPPLPLALTYVAKDLAGLAAGLPPSAE